MTPACYMIEQGLPSALQSSSHTCSMKQLHAEHLTCCPIRQRAAAGCLHDVPRSHALLHDVAGQRLAPDHTHMWGEGFEHACAACDQAPAPHWDIHNVHLIRAQLLQQLHSNSALSRSYLQHSLHHACACRRQDLQQLPVV